MLQQHLPLAVLKQVYKRSMSDTYNLKVATALTACGIETLGYGENGEVKSWVVATALTACGIETTDAAKIPVFAAGCNSTYRLRY